MAIVTGTTITSTTRGWIYTIALVLLIIGGLNWGFIGLLGINLVELIFGIASPLARLIYILVGISAVYVVVVMVMNRT